jgi:hypothetical protein
MPAIVTPAITPGLIEGEGEGAIVCEEDGVGTTVEDEGRELVDGISVEDLAEGKLGFGVAVVGDTRYKLSALKLVGTQTGFFFTPRPVLPGASGQVWCMICVAHE